VIAKDDLLKNILGKAVLGDRTGAKAHALRATSEHGARQYRAACGAVIAYVFMPSDYPEYVLCKKCEKVLDTLQATI
jgi:hypothetical protein